MGTSAILIADYHQFWLSPSYALPQNIPVRSTFQNGLLMPVDFAVRVDTGIAMGPVSVTVEVTHEETALSDWDDDGWEDIVEVDFLATADQLSVIALMDPSPEALQGVIPTTPGAWYTIRGAVRGRDEAYDAFVEELLEYYLLQVWPCPNPRSERVLRQIGRSREAT